MHRSSPFEKILELLRFVKDEVCCVVGVSNFPISRQLVSSVKNAHSKYVADLKMQKEIQSQRKTGTKNEEEGAGCITGSKTGD